MKRIHKHGEIGPELRAVRLDSLDRRIRMVCLTEFWCGDAAQNLPFIQLLAENSPWSEIRYLFRDENTELMDRYLTRWAQHSQAIFLMPPRATNWPIGDRARRQPNKCCWV